MATSCGFKSHLPHTKKQVFNTCFFLVYFHHSNEIKKLGPAHEVQVFCMNYQSPYEGVPCAPIGVSNAFVSPSFIWNVLAASTSLECPDCLIVLEALAPR